MALSIDTVALRNTALWHIPDKHKYDCQGLEERSQKPLPKGLLQGNGEAENKTLHMQQNFLKLLLSNYLPSLTGPSSFPYFPSYLFSSSLLSLFYLMFLQLLFQDYLPPSLGLFLHFCFIPLPLKIPQQTHTQTPLQKVREGECLATLIFYCWCLYKHHMDLVFQL